MKYYVRNFIIIVVLFLIALDSELAIAKDKRAEFYKTKYKAECLSEKIVDNFGNGYAELYGTRNMRTVLYGVAYRGGANNYFHKTAKRDNRNPLPNEGLQNLANEGFSTSVYLYPNNFDTAEKGLYSENKKNKISYIQNSGASKEKLRKLLELIKRVIDDPEMGPVYLHCWNGWHQSGYVAAAVLMQYCNLSNEQAVEYWIENTDGANKGYDHVKNKIREFVPYDDLRINAERQSEICPCMKKDKKD